MDLQKPLQIPGKGEKFADLVITVNKNDDNECIYLIELKYLTKTATSAKGYKQNLEKLINDAAQQVSEYKTAIEFQNKNIKAYVMIFAGPECVYCQMQ